MNNQWNQHHLHYKGDFEALRRVGLHRARNRAVDPIAS